MGKLERIRAFCEADPKNPFAWYSLAMEERKADPRASLATFERVHTEHPAYLPSYYQYAQALAQAGEPERARVLYEEGIEVARRAGDAHAEDELRAALDAL